MWHGLFGADQPIGVGAHLLVAPVAVIQRGGAGTENLGHAAFAPHGCHNGPERILIPTTDWRKRHHARNSVKSRGQGSSQTFIWSHFPSRQVKPPGLKMLHAAAGTGTPIRSSGPNSRSRRGRMALSQALMVFMAMAGGRSPICICSR